MQDVFHPDPGLEVGALPTRGAGDAFSATIVALQAEDLAQVEAHLLRLAPQDRSLRFSAGLVTDETIRRYVAGIRFDRDAVLGLIDASGSIVGVAHGCMYSVAGHVHVETAFSIDACLAAPRPRRPSDEGGRIVRERRRRTDPDRHMQRTQPADASHLRTRRHGNHARGGRDSRVVPSRMRDRCAAAALGRV